MIHIDSMTTSRTVPETTDVWTTHIETTASWTTQCTTSRTTH